MSSFALASDINTFISYKIDKLQKSERSVTPTNVFLDVDISELIIESSLLAGAYSPEIEIPQLTHWITAKDFKKWYRTHIPYSQIAMTNKYPENNIQSNNLGKDIADYLTTLRMTGPHLLFEIRHPEFNNALKISENISSVFSQDSLIAVGVLPLIEVSDNLIKLKQGKQSVKLFCQHQPLNSEIVSYAEDKSIELALANINAINRKPNKIHWLDKKSIETLENKLTVYKNQFGEPTKYDFQPPNAIIGHLIIELPTFQTENVYFPFLHHSYQPESSINLIKSENNNVKIPENVQSLGGLKKYYSNGSVNKKQIQSISIISDFVSASEIGPIEKKYRKISWNLHPSFEEQQKINLILQYPRTKILNEEECELLWDFRLYISNDGKALKKFVQAIRWSTIDNQMNKEAIRLIIKWKNVPPIDSIEILSVCCGTTLPEEIYIKAMEILSELKDIHLFLLELTQMLRYDYEFTMNHPKHQYLLFNLLASKVLNNFEHANFFYWYLKSEASDPDNSVLYEKFLNKFQSKLSAISSTTLNNQSMISGSELSSSLPSFNMRLIFQNQQKLINELLSIYDEIFKLDNVDATRLLRERLSQIQFPEPIPLPINPAIHATGFVTERCSVLKSNTKPLRLTFSVAPVSENDQSIYSVIFKKGDDVRLDMFFLQMLQFIDDLLQSENYNLHLTPYRVLATSNNDGFIEFVQDSTTFSALDNENRSIKEYLSSANGGQISSSIIDVFSRSCAGYAAITYLFGVGDRHWGNLMLKKTGNMFHIDFGFIFGNEPKGKGFISPHIKVTPHMIEAFGGENSVDFQTFITRSCEVYNRVRTAGTLVIALAALMGDSKIIKCNNDLGFLESRFALDKSDEEAIHNFKDVLMRSATSKLILYADKYTARKNK